MKRIFTLITILNILALQFVSAITLPNFDVISNTDGLPSDVISDVCCDKLGYVWVGTDCGIARYDGINIKRYFDDNEEILPLLKSPVNCISVDSDNMVWVGCNGGVYTINPNDDHIEVFDEVALANHSVKCLLALGDDVWFGTNDELFRYNKAEGRFTIFGRNPRHLQRSGIRHLAADERGNIWVLHTIGGASVYEKSKDRFHHLNSPLKVGQTTFTSLFFEDGRAYATTWENGIYEISYSSDYQEFNYRRSNVIKNGVSLSIAKDTLYNKYWVASSRGVYVLDDLIDATEIDLIGSGSSLTTLTNESVSCITYTPEEKLLWFGTIGGGVNKLALSSHIINNNDLSEVRERFNSNTVMSIYNHGDELLLGVRNGVLATVYKNSGRVTTFDQHPIFKKISRQANGINTFAYIKHRNELWLGSRYRGIWIVEMDDEQNFVDVKNIGEISRSNPKSDIEIIFEDSKGRVWVNYAHRLLSRFEYDKDGELIARRLTRDKVRVGDTFMPNCNITDIAEDKLGDIYIVSSDNGIWRYSDRQESEGARKFEKVQICNTLAPLCGATTVLCDSHDNLLVGTRGNGLLIYNYERGCFEVVDQLTSLGVLTVNSIVEGTDDSIWFGTNIGVVQCDRESKTSLIFTHFDGLKDNIYIDNAVATDDEGRVYYGGYNGFSMIDRQSYLFNDYDAKMIIADVNVYGKSVLHHPSPNDSKIERSDDGSLSKLLLSSDDSTFSIDFSLLSMLNPDKNSYEYMLEGFDTEMQQSAPGSHVVSYNNLDSGWYTLRVYGYNSSGVRSSQPALLEIYVAPEWYNSWWALLCWFVLLCVVVATVAYYIAVRIRLVNNLKIARIEGQRSQELNSAKLQFFANVSHELLTPLSIISCGLDDLKNRKFDYEKTYEVLKSNINRLMYLTEQILEFRKADTGNLKLKVAYGDIRRLIMKIATENFSLLLKKKNLRLTVDCPEEHIYGWFDKDKVDKMIYNLLSNAYKYNVEGGEIWVEIETFGDGESQQFDSIVIRVTNTGDVISEEQMKTLFTRFYDGAYRKFNTKGVGIGLSLTKDLVELHQGTIKVSSSHANGTMFTIELPLRHDDYFDEERSDAVENIIVEDDAPILEETSFNGVVDNNFVDNSPVDSTDAEGRPTLLLAEDDLDLQYVMESLLKQSFNVITSANGQDALNWAIQNNPDIIVSDVIMPGMTGYELCSQLKSDIRISHIPVILLTAKIAESDKIEGLNSGAEAYLTKPVQIELLQAQINSLLNKRKMLAEKFRTHTISNATEESVESSEYISYNDKFLDEAVMVVKRNLSNTNFDLKEFQQELNVTKSTLYRKLKFLTNMSPNEFIRHIRLKSAYNILMENRRDINISELAYHTGFNTPRYFSLCFKTEYGVTPSQFVEKLRSGEIPVGNVADDNVVE